MEKSQAKVGMKVRVTSINGVFERGEIVTISTIEGLLGCAATNADNKTLYKRYSNLEVVLTPAQEAGFVIGNLYQVTDNSPSCAPRFSVGDVIEFIEDDGTVQPDFRRNSDGETQYVKLAALVPYVELEKTPMEAAGYKVGDKFIVTRDSNFAKGTIITFTQDDDSTIPRFTDRDGVSRYEGMSNIKPYVEAEKTPAQEAGVVLGTKARAISKTWGVPAGSLLELTGDDGTTHPRWQVLDGKRAGEFVWYPLSHVTLDLTSTAETKATTANGTTTITTPALSAAKLAAVLALIAEPEIVEPPAPVVEPVVAPAGFKQPYRVTGNSNYSNFEIGDIVYIAEDRSDQPFSTTHGMSKSATAIKRDYRGNVMLKDMEKVQAYKIIANNSMHSFEIGDIVYEAGKQKGAHFNRPYADMSKNPAAKERDSSGGVYHADRVAI